MLFLMIAPTCFSMFGLGLGPGQNGTMRQRLRHQLPSGLTLELSEGEARSCLRSE